MGETSAILPQNYLYRRPRVAATSFIRRTIASSSGTVRMGATAREKTIFRTAFPGIMASRNMKPDSTAPRALVIEDSPHVAETVTEMLETMGHTWEGCRKRGGRGCQGGSRGIRLRKRFWHEVAGSAPPRFLHEFGGSAVCRHNGDWRAFAGGHFCKSFDDAHVARSCAEAPDRRGCRPDTPCRRLSALRFSGDGFRCVGSQGFQIQSGKPLQKRRLRIGIKRQHILISAVPPGPQSLLHHI